MCGEDGSLPTTPLAVLPRRVAQVFPHHAVRLHHEGAVSRRRGDEVFFLFFYYNGTEIFDFRLSVLLLDDHRRVSHPQRVGVVCV